MTPRMLELLEAAVCASSDPEVFFPVVGGSAGPAKAMCGLCDVQEECRAEALSDAGLDGVWGGLTLRERRRLRNAAGEVA